MIKRKDRKHAMVLKRTKMWPLGEIKTNKWKFHKFSNGDKNLNLHIVHPDSSYGKDPFTMQCRRPLFNSWVGLIRWRRDRLPAPVFLGFPCDSAGKEPTCNVGDMGSVPGLGRSPGEGKDYPLQYSGLENSMDCIVHGVTKSWTWLSDFHFTHFSLNTHLQPRR